MAYQPIQMPQPDGLGGLAEIILQARRQSQQEEQARAEMLLRRQQHEAQVTQNYAQQQQNAQQMGLQGAQFQMQQQRAQEESAQRRLKATTEITAALDQGRPDLARQIAKTFGIDMAENPAQSPKDTLMRPSPETPRAPEYGPQATPEIALNAARIRSEQDSFDPSYGPDSAGGQGQDSATLARQFSPSVPTESQRRADAMFELTRFEQAQRPFEMIGQMPMPPREATYTVNGEQYDPQQRREAEAKTRDLNTQRFAGAFQDVEGMSKYIPVYQAGVTAGLAPEKAFELMQKRMETDSEAARKAEELRLRLEQSDVNSRRMSAAIGAGKGTMTTEKVAAGDRAEEATIDQMTKNVFGNLGFKEARTVCQKYTRMATMLAKPNAASDAVVAGSFVKEAQGGTGVISDADFDAFWNKIGGAETRTKQWVESVLSGKIHPEKRAIVAQTVNALAQFELEKQEKVKDALRYRLQNSSLAHRTDAVIGTYFPSERNRIEEARRIQAAKERTEGATRAKRLKGGGRDALDAELEGL